VERIERIAEALRSLDLDAGVAVEGRTFVGPPDAIARLRDLEGIAAGLSSRDLFALYDKSFGNDGVFDEDMHASGRYYAYLRYELKGATPEDREASLVAALEDLITQYGKDAVISRIPARIDGRQISEAITLRPDPDDFPAYYSKSRMAYAEKMILDELPKAVLAGIRADQERLLDSFGWTTLRVQDKAGTVVDICGDAYLLSEQGLAHAEPYRAIWAALVDGGCEKLYDFEVRTDGEYAADIDEALGRYYAYVCATLKGQAPEERRERLLAALPPKAVESLGADVVVALFKASVAGDQVTASLTIRPETEEFASYINAKKVESGKVRLRKQILINVEAELIGAVEGALGGIQKYIILD